MKFCIILNGDIDEILALHYIVKNFYIEYIIHEEKYIQHDKGLNNIYDILNDVNKDIPVYISNKGKLYKNDSINSESDEFVNIVHNFNIIDLNNYNFICLGVFKTLKYIIESYNINYFHCFIGKKVAKDDIDDWNYLINCIFGKCYSVYDIKNEDYYKYIIQNNLNNYIKNKQIFCLKFVIEVFRI